MRPIEGVRRDYSRPYLRGLSVGLARAYRQSSEASAGMYADLNVRSNTAPWIRRGFVEEMLLRSANGHDGIVATQVHSGYFWYHTEVRAGNCILTQALQYDPAAPLRRAAFRDELSNQQTLSFSDDEVIDESQICAILLHHRLEIDSARVGYAVIRCARRGMNGWFDGGINLIHDFPDVFGLPGRGTEEIDEGPFPDLLDEEGTGS